MGFASDFNSCEDPLCSYAYVSEDTSGGWQIDEMILFIDGYITIDNGTSSVALDRGYLELSGPAKGTWSTASGPTTYEVEIGDAAFVVGGTAGSNNGFLTAHNSTTITAAYALGEWSFPSFGIEYDDPSHGSFTLTIDPSTWLDN